MSAVALTLIASFTGDALADDKRQPQDYGRPKEDTTVSDVAAWPVRGVLFPFFLINEFVLRRPIGFLVVAVEKNRVVETLQDFFTFGPRNEITIYPSALFDFGLLPSVGFNLSWSHFLAERNTFTTHFGTWGPTWINAKITDTYQLSKRENIGITAEGIRRRDNPYFGLGSFSDTGARTRYGAETIRIAPFYERDLWRSSSFQMESGFRGLNFFRGTCCADPSLDFAIEDGRLPTPPGWQRSYFGGFQRMTVAIDSRKARPAPGSGLRVEAHEETMFDLADHTKEERRSWIKWGGSAGGAWDITGHQRVLALTAYAEFTDPIKGQVPFTDLTSLGGDDVMPGFIRRRLVDRSSAVAKLQYTWPVWMYLDGVITASLGNVWGKHLDNFKIQDSRLNAGVGVRSNGNRDSGFELLVGAGTDPLSEGFGITSFRFLVGSHHGF